MSIQRIGSAGQLHLQSVDPLAILIQVESQMHIVDYMKKLKLFDDEPEEKKFTKKKEVVKVQSQQPEPLVPFKDIGLKKQVVDALAAMEYQDATPIQSQSLPHSLAGKDMLCLSQTGSGKTLSFVLPIVNQLVEDKKSGFALILSPTRQLSLQTKDYFDRFEKSGLSISTVAIYGGCDPMKQVIELSRKPAVLIGTPGRVLHHLQNTKGFNLNNLRYLVLDEADKLLNMDFQKQINDILDLIPKNRITSLYSATLTSKVNKLQRVSLKNPVKIELSHKYQTVQRLEQRYIFIPAKHKDCYLIYLLNKMKQLTTIVYVKTCLTAIRIDLMLKDMKFKSTCLHGDLTQACRQSNLNKFRNGQRNILVSTDVSSRGIDVSGVQLVMNYDVPPPKDYIHRVGRTARMGKDGLALTIVTQYDVEDYQRIEECLGQQLTEYQIDEKEALIFQQRVELSQKEATKKIKDGKKRKKSEEDI